MDETERASLFGDEGFVAPIPVFSARECLRILARLRLQGEDGGWSKGWATASRDYYDVATDDRIVDLVAPLLGPNIVLWGASLVARRPGEHHPWHSDKETAASTGRTASVWIPLRHGGPRSSLGLIASSHRLGVSLQQMCHEANRTRGAVPDAEVETWARRFDPSSALVRLGLGVGEAVVFDGRVWHRSYNDDPLHTRYALLLQFAAAETPIRIPSFEGPVWPFEYHEHPRPGCLVVRGRAHETPNRIVRGPPVDRSNALPSLQNRVHPLALPLMRDPGAGWRPHHLFRGSTAEVSDFGCHVSVLEPGREPHPPHRHDEEEVLVVLDGEADLVWSEAVGAPEVTRQRARRGDFVYYPAGSVHTISNPTDAPVSYLMFKWISGRGRPSAALSRVFVPLAQMSRAEPDHTGFVYTTLLEGETDWLRRLHAHVTVVEPGAEYPAHADAHDVAIVILEGTLETLDRRVGPCSVVFHPAGELHGMRNVGALKARYLVFEFRGRRSGFGRSEFALLMHRIAHVVRDPRRLASALRRRATRVVDLARFRP